MSGMFHHSVEAGMASERWEPLLKRFDRAWLCGPRPVIEDYLPADPAGRKAALMELVHEDLEHRLRAGEAARVEEYIEQYPELKGVQPLLLNLLATEWRIRRRHEPGLALEEYLARLPQHRHELTSSLTPGPEEARAPDAGAAGPVHAAGGRGPRRVWSGLPRPRYRAGSDRRR